MSLPLIAIAFAAAIAKPPAPVSPYLGLTVDDYPPAAVRNALEGVVRYRAVVDAQGSVSDCQIMESSGHAELDEPTCMLVRSRGRFTPALDQKGHPVAGGQWDGRIIWRLPHDPPPNTIRVEMGPAGPKCTWSGDIPDPLTPDDCRAIAASVQQSGGTFPTVITLPRGN